MRYLPTSIAPNFTTESTLHVECRRRAVRASHSRRYSRSRSKRRRAAAASICVLLASLVARPADAFEHELPPHVVAEGALFVTSIAAYGWTTYLSSSSTPMRELEGGALRPLDPGLSRVGTAGLLLTLAGTGITCVGTADLERAAVEGGRYLSAVAFAAALKDGLKALFPRPRPYVAPGFSGDRAEAYSSFPSGHATLAWAAAGVAGARGIASPGWTVTDWSAVASASIAVGVSILRVVSGEHYVTDVVAGAILGLGVGILVEILPLAHEPAE